jgi:hypothetical protein
MQDNSRKVSRRTLSRFSGSLTLSDSSDIKRNAIWRGFSECSTSFGELTKSPARAMLWADEPALLSQVLVPANEKGSPAGLGCLFHFMELSGAFVSGLKTLLAERNPRMDGAPVCDLSAGYRIYPIQA